MAPRISETVDLTIEESEDDEVQFMGATQRPSAPNGSQTRKNPHVPGSRKSGSHTKSFDVRRPTKSNGTPIDLRLDPVNTEVHNPRFKETLNLTSDDEPKRNWKATKSAPSGPLAKPRSKETELFSDTSSNGEELPDPAKFLNQPSPRSQKLAASKSGISSPLAAPLASLKRPLDAESSSLASGRSLKKTKQSEGHANPRAASRESPETTTKKLTPSQEAQKDAKQPSSKSSPGLVQRQSKDAPHSRSVSVSAEARSNPENRQFLGPFGRRKPWEPVSLEGRNPQEKRPAPKPAKDSAIEKPSPNSASLRGIPKGNDKQTQWASQSSVSSERRSKKHSNSTQRAARDSPLPAADRHSAERSGAKGEQAAAGRPTAPTRALNLLNSATNKRAPPQQKRAGSSEDDQGYGSLGSGHSEDQERSKDPAEPKAQPQGKELAGPKAQHHSKQLAEPKVQQQKAKSSDPIRARLDSTTQQDAPVSTEAKVKERGSSATNAAKDTASPDLRPQEDDAVGEKSTEPATNSIETATERVSPRKSPLKRKSSPTAKVSSVPPQLQDNTPTLANQPAGSTNEPKTPREARASELASDAAEANDQLQSEARRDLEQRQSVAQSDSVFALPVSAASALKSTAAYAKLSLAAKVEKVLGQYLEELAEDNEYWTSNFLKRARLSKEIGPQPQPEHDDKPSSFGHLKALPVRPHQKTDSWSHVWGIEKMAANGKPTSTETVKVPHQTFTTDTEDVPRYAHYVSIKNNILAPNVKTLHCWPYFGDDFDCSTATGLEKEYHLDIDGREQKLLRLRQAQKYEEYVESALQDLGCSWADVLRFLLEPKPAVGNNPDAVKALDNRQNMCKEEFNRDHKRWQVVLAELPPSSTEKLAHAAVLCENFEKLARFPLWHIARRSGLCKLPEELDVAEDDKISSDELTCRICMRTNCPYHGELTEPTDDEDDNRSEESGDSVVATDLVNPPTVNYRTRIAFPVKQQEPSGDVPRRPEKKDLRYWQSFENKADARGVFYPCSHLGLSCEDKAAECSCHAENLPCEKSCGCADECPRKFQGCSCSTKRFKVGKRGPCFDDERCACWQLGRECDPDLCDGCGICEVVDPINKYDDSIPHGRCQNGNMQRARPKCTLLGDSGVHGLGLYACEDIKSNEFVGEYVGEIITKEEAERRGAIYEHQNLSYLFSLNKDQEIDSTHFGSEIRFINHASGYKANLYPRIIMVNTVHRIALYAASSVKAGQELLFDYGPMFPDEQLGGKSEQQSKKSAPHVRNANLVKSFYEVEKQQDEQGNVRAKGVAVRKNKTAKARGGARAGAGRKPRTNDAELPLEPQREKSPEDEFAGQDAGQRLAAYNVFDDVRSDHMDGDLAAGAGAEEDDEEYQESEESEVEESEESEESEDEEAEADGIIRRKRGRPSGTRKRRW